MNSLRITTGKFISNISITTKKTLTVLVIAILLGLIIWQSQLYFGKSYQKNSNYITLQAKTEAKVSGKDPCDILSDWLVEAKITNNKQRIADIERAQKFMGCRNKQKRQSR